MDDTRITRSVELEAPAEAVWRALTEPALLSDWLEGEVLLDIQPGGDGVIVERDGALRRARVEEVDPVRRLALHWWPEDGSEPASKVELELEETTEGTRLVVTETLVAPRCEASVTQASLRWGVRFLLLGCCLLQATVACR